MSSTTATCCCSASTCDAPVAEDGSENYLTTMLVRLILALLLAAFATPAAASMPACHDAPVGTATHSMSGEHHEAPRQDDRATPTHLCIGCVPPAGNSAPVEAPRLLSALAPVATIARLDLATGNSPRLPPPRSV